ncbi:DUF4178 domain-containing protein [Tellurirhabdus rosea]|uniref:DUF4178 domain-containing protein n=1 Tax=Tellurirhabdus rosea TaxID=2674997 RepID=UPI0022545633|nr:DUF4178 domain-containing protein [Tellurirhabdus rosea]
MPGSPSSVQAPAQLDCPKCHASVPYYDVTGSSFYACPACHAFFEYENEGPPNPILTFSAPATPLLLPIGTTGTLEGQPVRVVGHIRRKEAQYSEEWSEYMLLLSPGVYWQLAEFEGHWTLITPAETTFSEVRINPKVGYVDADDRRYELYNRYTPQTLHAVGEFDWNILLDDKMRVSEYIAPPHGLVREKVRQEETWYRSVHKSRRDIEQAFGIADLPARYGVGALQPSGQDEVWKPLQLFTMVMAGLLLVGQVILIGLKPERTLVRSSLVVGLDSASFRFQPFVTGSFAVDGPAAIEIGLEALLDNNWVELPLSLINEQTGKSYNLTKVLEYYSGYEDGESWSEGSRQDEAVLSRIPSGRYHLNLYPTTDPGKTVKLEVKVVQNPSLLSNFLLFALLLLIYPVYQFFHTKHIEQKRWANSDYGPENQ